MFNSFLSNGTLPFFSTFPPLIMSLPVVSIDQMIKNHLLLGSVDDIFIYRGTGNKPEDLHLFFLANSVGSSYCLQIILRIPITVEDDNSVGSLKIDTKSSSFSRQ